ncbi:ETC complex I subunit [uncultured Cohaesibacter sp.]|uniref:ETC complex I subunit n=1 Tax=uncultured Cohaesibacter sp. TaxID=1002546 RepID=UPI0029C82979|nr:ETC complex I subunit [uncultured Cohaesibacter sp.]
MKKARIFKPSKNAMQSGQANSQSWVLSFEPGSASKRDPLTGHISSSDTNRQVKLTFPTQNAAISYAERQGLDYQILEPKTRKRILKAYSDNFATGRIEGNWTH